MKIFSISTNRNGISGDAFATALIGLGDRTLILTIGYKTDGITFDRSSCRIVNPFDINDFYRGDDIGAEFIDQYCGKA